VDAHRLDDTRPYLWKTTDYGKTWKSLAGSLPKDVYLHAVREDPKRRGLLYAGSERGVSFSADDGATWRVLGLNLPTVAVHDLVVKDDDLVLGTHGRSVWILDDLTPVRQWSKEIAGEAVHLFPAQPAVRWEYRGSFESDGQGENPPQGVLINYSLKQKIEGDLRLEILDGGGAVVKVITNKKETPEEDEDAPDAPNRERKKPVLSAEAGVQRVAWDLSCESAMKIKKAKYEGNAEAAPRAVPGHYTARLTVDGKSYTTPLEVRPDPRLTLPASDLEAQLAFARQVQAQVTRLSSLVTQIRSVRDQIRLKSDALSGNTLAADWMKAAQDLAGKCDALEKKLHNPEAQVEYDVLAKGARLYSRMSPLLSFVTDGTGAPTQGMRDVFAGQVKELDALETEWQALVGGDLAALGRRARELNLDGVVVPRVEAKAR